VIFNNTYSVERNAIKEKTKFNADEEKFSGQECAANMWLQW
jgi:hypothetical protein